MSIFVASQRGQPEGWLLVSAVQPTTALVLLPPMPDQIFTRDGSF